MFRKKPSWYLPAIKALIFAGLLYKMSSMFMKSTMRPVPHGKKAKKGKNDDIIDQVRRLLKTGGAHN